jgi:polysaccharide chain length determinant protein (PEP-CTERM system associated)
MVGRIMNINYRLYYILSAAWRRRYTVVMPMLLLPLLGFTISFLSPKNYASHTSMLIQETASLNPFLEDLAVSAMLKERMSALSTLLHSRHILSAVAKERQLVNEKTTPAQHDDVIRKISNALTVSMLGKDLIRIDYKANKPEGMKETLALISQQFVEQLLAPERSSMKDSSHFLSEHLKIRQVELDKAELALANFKDEHAAELPELHLANIARLGKLQESLAERQAELAGATKSLGGLDQQLSKTNPVVGRIEEKIVTLQGELALLRAKYTDQHSAIRGVLRNLSRLEEERQHLLKTTDDTINIEQLWAIASSANINSDQRAQPLLISQLQNIQQTRSRVDGLNEEVNSLTTMSNTLAKQMSSYGEKASELSKLERELSIKRELYDDLLMRFEKVEITGSLGIFEQDKRIKVIDRPFTPASPSNPPLILFILGGLFGGLFLGTGLATVFELSDTSLRKREELEQLTGVKVFSRIPYIRDDMIVHSGDNP